jgi:hypothetical protein
MLREYSVNHEKMKPSRSASVRCMRLLGSPLVTLPRISVLNLILDAFVADATRES